MSCKEIYSDFKIKFEEWGRADLMIFMNLTLT